MREQGLRRIVAAALFATLVSPPDAVAGPQDSAITGGAAVYRVVAADTWRSIGSRLGVDVATLARDNGRASNAPLRPGDRLAVDNRHIVPDRAPLDRIVINVPQRILFFVDGDGRIHGFPVAVGRPGWPTPVLPFRIVVREENPSWDVPPSIREEARRAGRSLPMRVPPGPDNPLGKYWLGLSIGDIGVHGTNAPLSIYRAVTHGCIRVHPDDIAWLFDHVDVQAPGAIVYQPILLAVVGDDVLLEAHPDVYHRDGDGLATVRRRAAALALTDRIDWTQVRRVLDRRDGVARPVTRAAGSSGD